MNLNCVKLFERVGKLTVKHAPELLAGLGIAGFCTTTVMAVKATPKAVKLIEEKKIEENTDELTKFEVVKTAWKPYVPAAVTGVSSALCIIGSVSTSLKRSAALATAYEVSREFINNYRSQVIDTIGEKKEQKIRHEVNQKMIDQNPPTQTLYDNRPRNGQLFMFGPTGAYFWSTLTEVDKKLVDCTNSEYQSEGEYLSVNEVQQRLGVFNNMNPIQEQILRNNWANMGWCTANQGEYVKFTCDRATVDRDRGEFIGVIEASIPPIDDYWVYYR